MSLQNISSLITAYAARMRTKISFGISTLTMAWFVFGLVLVALSLYVRMMPLSEVGFKPNRVELAMPSLKDLETAVAHQEPLISSSSITTSTPQVSKVSAPSSEEKSILPVPVAKSEDSSITIPPAAFDTRPRWEKYAMNFEVTEKPKIAIIIGGLGLSKSITTDAIQRLPSEVSLAFAPYAMDLERWLEMAADEKHEALLSVPMEPHSYPHYDPGPYTLLTGVPADQNVQRLKQVLDQAEHYMGVMTFMGSRFTTSENDVRPIMEELKKREVLVLDSRTSNRSVVGTLGTELKMPFVLNDRFLDQETSRTIIKKMLEELERMARSKGYAVGIGMAYPVTLDSVRSWSKTLPAKGIELVPLSVVVQVREKQQKKQDSKEGSTVDSKVNTKSGTSAPLNPVESISGKGQPKQVSQHP